MREISSNQNPIVKGMRALRDGRARAEQGRLLVEGEKMIREAVSCGLTPFDALVSAPKGEKFAPFAAWLEEQGANVYLVPERLIEAVSDTKSPQGVVAAFSMPVFAGEAGEKVIALDAVQDPGNVGTIWRTADAAGFGGLLLGANCADPYSPKVQRAAMGSGFRLPAIPAGPLCEALAALRARGWTVVASALDGADFYQRPEVGERFVLVIGSEAHGISEEVRAQADALVKLPMRGRAESLNAAVAAGIMMYEMMRER